MHPFLMSVNKMTLVFQNPHTITDSFCRVEVYNQCLNEDTSRELLNSLITNAKWNTSLGIRKRSKCIYGSVPLYRAVFQGKPHYTKVHNWDKDMPLLRELAEQLSAITGDHLNTCVLQYYPSGKVGISPHRDKEVESNQWIVSLSLGATRTMRFEYRGANHDIPLPHGSICIIYPPTNSKWAHSIPCDDTTEPRISLVFRHVSA